MPSEGHKSSVIIPTHQKETFNGISTYRTSFIRI
jgi:hypothetical protein